MKANELRVGNFVYGNIYHTIYKIEMFLGLSDVALDGINGYDEHDKSIDELKPIPLNEEWLLKFGFHDTSYNGVYFRNWGTNGSEIIKFHSVYNKFGLQLGKGRNKILDHVHQLQNLYFALTGEELILMPL